MDISVIKKTQLLANLKIRPKKLQKLAKEFSKIIGYINVISKFKDESLPSYFNPSDNVNVFVKDKAVLSFSLSKDDALKNAPKKYKNYFVVPKVINHNNE